MNWKKSSYSNPDGNCVEFAQASSGVLVRDSQDPHGPRLPVHAQHLSEFLDRVRQPR